MNALLRDVTYGLRRLRNSPGFSAVVVLTLALGIGANTAIFSVVNAVLLRPLAFREPERLVTINHFYDSPRVNFLEAPVSAPGFRDYRDRTRSFSSVAVETGWAANLTGIGDPERVVASRVSGDFFRTLGVAPQLGRAFGRDEDEPGREMVVVVSDGFWKRVLGARPDVLRQSIELNGRPYRIVAVMPPGFRSFFSREAEIWTPLALAPAQFDPQRYTNESLMLTARLAPGVSIEQAGAEMKTLAARIRTQHPENVPPVWTLRVKSLDQLATGSIRPALLVLLGAVGFVLLIACANVVNLLLARAAARGKEVAIRSALGAERGALVRQLLTESVMLALLGGALGLGLAYWGVRSLATTLPGIPRADEVSVDVRVMLFTLGVALVTGVLFGLAPALQTSRTDLQAALREGGRTGSADARGHALRRTLVVAEFALALTLLVGAGLLIRSVARLQAVAPGFAPDHLVTFSVSLPDVKYRSDTARALFYESLLARIAQVPGVEAAGATSVMPFGGGWSTGSFNVEGYAPAPGTPSPWGDIRIVTPGFFRALRIPLEEGRLLSPDDRLGSRQVAVVDERLARQFFPGGSAVGRHIYFPDDPKPEDLITIVGVVGHTAHEGLDAEERVQLYFSVAQAGRARTMTVAARTTGEPLLAVNALRRAVREVDRDMPIAGVRTMEEMIGNSMGQRRLSMLLLGAFSAIALLLASIGIYGVMSYAVAQRTRELGLRMALGAPRGRVLRLVVRQGMTLAALGVAIGLAGAWSLTRLLGSQLYAVSATDPATFATVAFVLGVVALTATLAPALRATRVDPVVALREE